MDNYSEHKKLLSTLQKIEPEKKIKIPDLKLLSKTSEFELTMAAQMKTFENNILKSEINKNSIKSDQQKEKPVSIGTAVGNGIIKIIVLIIVLIAAVGGLLYLTMMVGAKSGF